MKNILNITNGDSAVKVMLQAEIPGTYLPWRDILHDGPVPEGLDIEELSRTRAQFIADCGWGKQEEVLLGFIQRDKQLKACNEYSKVILWFEHDLYDQLQIVQILDCLQQSQVQLTKLSIICTDQYLGMQTPDEMYALQKHESHITIEQLQLATKAWTAFRSPTPEKWAELLISDTSALPFLQGAIIRQLEEYPSTLNGLSRTAHKALEIISREENRPEQVFHLYQQTEERRFLGDLSFWGILQQLLQSSPPLISQREGSSHLSLPSTQEQTLAITPHGKEMLVGQKNWLEITVLNHWIGGVHLTQNNIWLWDADARKLVKQCD